MIQVNLLPDIKAAYVKAERTKRLVVGISIISITSCLGFLGLLGGIAFGAQSLQLKSVQSSINKNVSTLSETQDLDKILTIQNQLLSLTGLHESKPVVTRLFHYIQQTTPTDVKLVSYSVGFDEGTIKIEGKADSLEQVNKFVDTLKFTDYTTAASGDATTKRAFSNVVLAGFSAAQGNVTFNINLAADKALFNSVNTDIALRVPTLTTTRSQTQQPDLLFVSGEEVEN